MWLWMTLTCLGYTVVAITRDALLGEEEQRCYSRYYNPLLRIFVYEAYRGYLSRLLPDGELLLVMLAHLDGPT